MQEYLIIDDLDPALALLPSSGHSTIATPAEWVRTAVLEYADRRGWCVVRHATFVEWARGIIASDVRDWLILDPLLEVNGLPGRAQRVRLTRRFDNNATIVRGASVIEHYPFTPLANSIAASVGVLDDAVASGRTMTHAARMAAKAGATVGHVVTCASMRLGRDTVRARLRNPRWTEYLPGDWAVVHLRDGCPHVPLAGMPARCADAAGDNGAEVELRVPSSTVAGHPWQGLMMDRQVSQAVRDAQAHVAAWLDQAVGRAATVGDLGVLGPNVPAMVGPNTHVDATTTLQSLIPA